MKKLKKGFEGFSSQALNDKNEGLVAYYAVSGFAYWSEKCLNLLESIDSENEPQDTELKSSIAHLRKCIQDAKNAIIENKRKSFPRCREIRLMEKLGNAMDNILNPDKADQKETNIWVAKRKISFIKENTYSSLLLLKINKYQYEGTMELPGDDLRELLRARIKEKRLTKTEKDKINEILKMPFGTEAEKTAFAKCVFDVALNHFGLEDISLAVHSFADSLPTSSGYYVNRDKVVHLNIDMNNYIVRYDERAKHHLVTTIFHECTHAAQFKECDEFMQHILPGQDRVLFYDFLNEEYKRKGDSWINSIYYTNMQQYIIAVLSWGNPAGKKVSEEEKHVVAIQGANMTFTAPTDDEDFYWDNLMEIEARQKEKEICKDMGWDDIKGLIKSIEASRRKNLEGRYIKAHENPSTIVVASA